MLSIVGLVALDFLYAEVAFNEGASRIVKYVYELILTVLVAG